MARIETWGAPSTKFKSFLNSALGIRVFAHKTE